MVVVTAVRYHDHQDDHEHDCHEHDHHHRRWCDENEAANCSAVFPNTLHLTHPANPSSIDPEWCVTVLCALCTGYCELCIVCHCALNSMNAKVKSCQGFANVPTDPEC